MSLDLTLTPITPSSLTASSIASLITTSLSLIHTLPPLEPTPTLNLTWTLHTSSGPLKLYKTTYLSLQWLGRVTTTTLPYTTVRRGLLAEKHETERASVMKEADTLTVEKEWTVEGGYTIQETRKLLHVQAFSPREFHETLILHDLPTTPRSFIVVSKPKDGPVLREGDVRGVYTCVEYVRELPDGAGAEIFFVVTSDAGGSIPRWVQNLALPGQILGDGVEFLRYFGAEEKV